MRKNDVFDRMDLVLRSNATDYIITLVGEETDVEITHGKITITTNDGQMTVCPAVPYELTEASNKLLLHATAFLYSFHPDNLLQVLIESKEIDMDCYYDLVGMRYTERTYDKESVTSTGIFE